jgi:hypothetical protein
VLRDLDRDAPCPGGLVKGLLPTRSRLMCLRIAVHSLESWLLADAQRLAAYLHVSRAKVPVDPDGLPDPKGALVDLAWSSTKPKIKEDMVPPPGFSRRIGRLYEQRIIEFARDHWRPEIARQHSSSLRRAIQALEQLRRAWPH